MLMATGMKSVVTLDRSRYVLLQGGTGICSRIWSSTDHIVQDIKTLKLTPNPVPASASLTPTDTAQERSPFVCPLTLKEMNGAHPFVYLATCGCVLSQAGLKAVTGSSSSIPTEESTKTPEEKQFEICPQCATKYDKKEDVRVLNPDTELQQEMRAAMEAQRLATPAKSSKSKKRKAESAAIPPTGMDASEANSKAKKAKSAAPAPTVNPSMAAASRAVVSSLAMEEAKRKAGMSDAVKSLYGTKDNQRKDTFMTRGTFTRVSNLCYLYNK